MFKKGDLVILIFVAAILGLFFLYRYGLSGNGGEITAVIKQEDKVLMEVDLSKVQETQHFYIDGPYPQTVRIENGRIRFEDAECPDKVCVKTGWLDKPGDASVCLPNKTIIYIESRSSDIDGISY